MDEQSLAPLRAIIEQHVPDYQSLNDLQIVEYLSLPRVPVAGEFRVTKRTLYSSAFGLGFDRGLYLMETLKAMGQGTGLDQIPTQVLPEEQRPAFAIKLAEVHAILNDVASGGVDINDPAAIQMVQLFVMLGLLTSEEGAKLLALPVQLKSLADVHYGGVVPTTFEVALSFGRRPNG